MTSKEMIIDIRGLINELYSIREDKEGLSESAKQSRKCFNKYCVKIEQDLDVLEILKPHLINSGIGKFDNVEDNELLHLKLTLNGEEYNRIKEWLKQ